MSDNPTLTWTDPSGVSLAVTYDRHDGDRAAYRYAITETATGNVLAEGDDLRAGSGEPWSLPRMLATLAGFCGAYAEAIAYERHAGTGSSDNAGLFPESFRGAADAIGADGFALIEMEMDPDQ